MTIWARRREASRLPFAPASPMELPVQTASEDARKVWHLISLDVSPCSFPEALDFVGRIHQTPPCRSTSI